MPHRNNSGRGRQAGHRQQLPDHSEYADEGISGDNAKRPGFQAMLRDAVEKRDFAAIICWDQDRFARFDSIKAGKYIDPLREAGVWLITKAQGVVDWNTFTAG